MEPPVAITITPMFWDYVHRWDKLKLNTNNLWDKGGRPDDYFECLDQTKTEHWIYRFHDPETIRTLTLDAEDLEWMNRARKIGRMTRAFSELYQDELKETLEKYHERTCDWLGGVTGDVSWFIRTERVSLKNGQHGAGPYTGLQQVLESLVSSNPGHECFNEEDTSLTLYFMPWLSELDDMKEFRVFIHEGKITAISQQALYTENPWLTDLYEKDELEHLVKHILKGYEEQILPRMDDYLKTYSMDLALVGPDLKLYFIEPNPFGAKYSAGSALFGWEQDAEGLHDPAGVEFRFTIASQECLSAYKDNLGKH